MSEHSNPKKVSLREKLKNTKVNRATVITLAALVLAIGVIVAISIASNRSKKNEVPGPDTTPPVTEPQPTPTPAPEDDTPAPKPSTPTGSDNNASQVENKLPSFILPVSGTLSKKHNAEVQVYSNTLADYRVHLGVDIVTEESASVYAAADGKIERIWADDMMGYCMAIKHSGNCYTIYQNLSETLPDGIKEGTAVRSGQLIASVGDSAMIETAEEPHLHFEMTVDDLSVDPLEYFSEKALESLAIDASFGE